MSRADMGRIPIVDPTNPQCWGRDDITGLPVMHTDMVKYVEWMGDGLQWTGMMTHYKDVDQPNPQLVPPRLRADPVPIDNPRYASLQKALPIPTGLIISNITSNSAEFDWTDIPGIELYSITLTSSFAASLFSATTSPYTFINLQPNSTYFVSVASAQVNSNGTAYSGYSNPILFTTL